MSLARLPAELHTEILFQIVFVNSENYDIAQVIETDITSYIVASRAALQCWRASRHLILHRVATIRLAATASYQRSLHRAKVLAKLRVCVWGAACIVLENERMFERLQYALTAGYEVRRVWATQEYCADYWRKYLLR
jgi:hypothetical protein